MTALVVVVTVVAVALWTSVEVAAVAGLIAVLSGEQIGRCPHCHRYGITTGGQMHLGGCPEALGAHAAHQLRSLGRHLLDDLPRLRHHAEKLRS